MDYKVGNQNSVNEEGSGEGGKDLAGVTAESPRPALERDAIDLLLDLVQPDIQKVREWRNPQSSTE